jgi:hypothetical protein
MQHNEVESAVVAAEIWYGYCKDFLSEDGKCFVMTARCWKIVFL